MFDSSLTMPIYSYYTQSNLQGNYGHIEIYSALRTKILEHLQDALMCCRLKTLVLVKRLNLV